MPTVRFGSNSADTHQGTDDTGISESNQTENRGGFNTNEVTKYASGDHRHLLIRFPGLTNISPGVTVTAATLYLYKENVDSAQNMRFDRLLRPWIESEATWGIYSTGNNWGTGGAVGGADIAGVQSASGAVSSGGGAYVSFTGAQLALDAQNIINQAHSNEGWLGRRSDSPGNDAHFMNYRMSEHATDGTRPYLEITYTTGPTLTDVDTDEIVLSSQTNVVATGTAFGASQGAGSVTLRQGSVVVTQSIDSWAATSIQFDVVYDTGTQDLKNGAVTARVTDNAGAYAELPITMIPPNGNPYVNLTSVHPVVSERISTTPVDIVAGGQIEARGVGGGAAPTGLTLNTDGTFFFSTGTLVNFDARYWDPSDQTWGAWATIFVVEDSTPDSFGNFTSQTNVALSTIIQAVDVKTLTGINVPISVSIADGEFRINGGAWRTSPLSVSVGSTIEVRMTSAATPATVKTATLTYGSLSATFTTTTLAIDTTPDPFSFVDQSGVIPNTLITSAPVTITGINSPSPITVVGGEYSVNGGTFTSSPGNVVNGNSVRVRHTSSTSYSTAVNTILTVGGVSDTFTSTTVSEALTPNPFTFAALVDQALQAVVESELKTITGLTGMSSVAITGGAMSINGGQWTASVASVGNGDTIRLRHVTANAYNTRRRTTILIGSLSVNFDSTTRNRPAQGGLNLLDKFYGR